MAALKWAEESRYQLIHSKFKELGGCREIDFNATNIEMMLVELGVEEPYFIDGDAKVRRRKRPRNGSEVNDERMSVSSTHTAEYSQEQKDEILSQIDSRDVKAEPPSPSPENELDMEWNNNSHHTVQGGGAAGRDVDHQGHHHSARVAMQACDKILRAAGPPGHQYYHDPRAVA